MLAPTHILSPGQASLVKTERVLWIDISKGIGIFLVVVGHALGGLIDAHLDNEHLILRTIFLYIYIFHMPLFFMLSGLTVQPRVADDPKKFVQNILLRIVYPYYLWSMIQLASIVSAGGLVNSPYSGSFIHQFLTLPWNPVSQFWFLQILAMLHLSSLVLLERVGPISFFLLTLCAKSIGEIVVLPSALSLFCAQAPYYGLGVLLGVAGVQSNLLRLPRWAGAALLAAATVLVVLTFDAITLKMGAALTTASAAAIANRCWTWASLAAALICAATIVFFSTMPRGGLASFLGYLGRRSFPIFVLHVMFVAGARICLMRFFELSSTLVLLPSIILAGLIGPLLVDRAAMKAGLSKWLGLG